jgi:3-oxoacyl-[acyl-carrier-protein] synthase II
VNSRVVITGMGIVCPSAQDVGKFADRVTGGPSGVERHTTIFPDAPVWAGLVDYRPEDCFTALEVEVLDRTALYAILAAAQALHDASLAPRLFERVGLVMGTSHGGRSQLDYFVENRHKLTPGEAALRVLVRAAHQSQTEAVARKLGIRGPVATLSNACSSSGAAIAYAFELLNAGKCDLVLAGGADAFSKLTYSGFRALGAMADGPCGPFSDTIGLSLGEGAGFVVLEAAEHARQRQVRVHAELLGYGMSWDAYHVTAPEPTGEGMLRALRMAMRHAGLAPESIDYINAHGTGTRANDIAECLALKRFFEPRGEVSPISATKSLTGHMLGASSVSGLIACVIGMDRGQLPPTFNFQSPRAGCDLDFIPNQARPATVRHFLSNSTAFGGANVVLAGGRVEPQRPRSVRSTDDVVITGLGVVSPIGIELNAFRAALAGRRCGITPLDRFPLDGCRARHAALVRDFKPRKVLPTLNLRRVDRVTEFAVVAAGLALKHAGLWPVPEAADRIGLIVGTTRGAAASYEKYLDSVRDANWSGASAVYFPNLVMCSIGGQVSGALGLKGIASTLVDGVASGLHALVHGFEMLRRNDSQNAVVIVAADEVTPLFFHMLNELGWLAPSDSAEGFWPYDPDAQGMVLGEGAVALVIERSRAARGRGATGIARIAGTGLAADADSASDPEGRGLQRAAEEALADSGLSPDTPDLVYGHGRGLPAYDASEAAALARLLRGRDVPTCCVNGHLGVAEAASGLFSVVAAVLGLAHGEAYPLARPPADDGRLPWVCGAVRTGDFRTALVAGGTGQGNNAALVLERCGEVR